MMFTVTLFAPGFFSSAPVRTALLVAGFAAVSSAVVGTFTVLRGQSFAGHSLADIGSAGGSAAFLVGVNPLYGFIAMNVVSAGVMELIGIRRPRGRDMSTGIVLGAALGLAALFLYLDTTSTSTTGATANVLFGSIFTLSSATGPVVVVLGLVSVLVMLILYRPLLLSSVSPDLASARGVPTRLLGVGYLVTLALAVSLSAVATGAILSTALLIGPAATAMRMTSRLGVAVITAAIIGIVESWVGIALAYDSYDWSSAHQGWPVSFCIVALVLVVYLITCLPWSRLFRRADGVEAEVVR
jgi:zinc/manganese transport system permease protein